MKNNELVKPRKILAKSKKISDLLKDQKAGTLLKSEQIGTDVIDIDTYEEYLEWVQKPKGRGYP